MLRDAFVISQDRRRRLACALVFGFLGIAGFIALSPGSASALTKHNLYPETSVCDQCHVMASALVEDNTSYLRSGARSLPTMKSLNGNQAPSSKASSGPKGVGCTFCHYNTGNVGRMKDVLEQFNGKLSQHPVDRAYALDNAATTRNVSLSANTNTTRWMSNWDNSWSTPANQVGCTDCHDVMNTANPGTGNGGYPDHTDASSAARIANPVMLRGGAASWNPAISHASNSFCVNICHGGQGTGTGGYKMGHYGWGAFDNAGATGTLKEPSNAALRTSNCVDCHETHYSGSQKNLFGELGETSRLLPSQSTSLISNSNCTGICHNDNTYVQVGHGRATSTSGIAMGVACIQCHDSSLSHRTPSNPKRLFREDTNKATLTDNLASNGLDDDFDGVIDNPEEVAVKRSGESNCSAGSCHADRHLHAGTGKINGTPGSASCLQCHDMHGNGVDNNIRMVKSTIRGKATRYWSKTDYMRSDNSATVASLCDNPGCHQKPLGNVATPGTILHDVSEHVQGNVGPGTDCSGCHSHTSATGSGSFLPACNNCHAYPGQAVLAGTHALSPVHAKHVDPTTGYGYVCSVCHYQNAVHNASGVTGGSDWNTKFVGANVKIRFDGAINPFNANGPTYNGVAADNGSAGASGLGTATTPGNGACQGLYCHANSASTRVWSGYAGAPTWNDNTSGACGTCHKAGSANPPTYGSHRKHVDNTTVGYGIGCNTCHYATTSDGVTITNRAAHVNASTPKSTVSWNPADNNVRNAGVYSLASRTCSNVYCHSTGTKIGQSAYDNGAFGWPRWTDNGAITCNHCHGDGTRTDGTPNYAGGSPKINSHPKHVAAGYGCQSCHVQTTTDGLTIANRANHVNSVYNVGPDNATHAFTTPYVTPNCSNIACHGANSATWGGTSPRCSDCHIGTGDTKQFQTANAAWYDAGIAASIDNNEWLYSGHGRKAGNYDVSGNPPADFGTRAGSTDPCYYCHDVSVGHRVSTNPFRLKVQTGVSGYGNAGWNATCLVCHSRTTTPPGYQPAGATLVAGAVGDRVDTAHYGSKHATDNTGGGFFCWDCHDPHGDRSSGTTGNIYMMQRSVLPKNDGLYGARGASGELNVGLVFLSDNTVANGGDWARTDFKGLCQVCHHGTGSGASTQAKYYTQSSDNTSHNSASVCISCHSHDNNLGASCSACHGDGGNRIWPQKAGTGPAAPSSLTADYNYDGRHTLHLTQVAARIGYAADNSTWTTAQQQAMCLYCHDYAADNTHATAGLRAKVFPPTGSRMLGGVVDNGSPAFAGTDNSCTSVQCHNRKGTTTAFNWYTGSAKQCAMCHTPGGALDNNPRSGLHAVTSAGVTKHDNTLPVGLNGQGGCQSCHWNTGWPAQSPTQTHINGTVADNLAATLNRPNLNFTDCTVNRNRASCSGFAPGSGLDNAAGVGCHSDRGAWKRLWSTEADNTATAVGSPRCNVCHGQWNSIAGSAGWRDNTSHFNADNAATGTHGKTHDGAPESCLQCHPYSTANHENGRITMNDNATLVNDNAAGSRAGCSQCHNGVDYANGKTPDATHTFPMSVFPMQKVVGVSVSASCYGCHGDGAKRYWPQNAGNVRGSGTMSDYNNAGDHTPHMAKLAARLGYPADNSTWTDNQQKTICGYCHDYSSDATHTVIGASYLAKVFNGAGRKTFWGTPDNNPTFDNGAYTCSNVACHNGKATPASNNWYAGSTVTCDICHTPGGALDNNPRSGLHAVTSAGVTKHDNTLPVGLNGQGGCQSCHWNTGWPAQSPTQTHINGTVADNLAATLNRPNLNFTDCTVNRNRASCSGFAPGSGLDNAAGVGCHSDRGAWKRLWSTEADNTSTAVGSPRCNVCHGQWNSIAGSAGWRDNTSHFNDNNSATGSKGSGHEPAGAPTCAACHAYDGGANHENRQVTMNDNATFVSDNASLGRAGCDGCHNGASYLNGKGVDNAHTLPMSVFPIEKVFGAAVPYPACSSCHDAGGSGAPIVKSTNGHTRTRTGAAFIACTACHAGHAGSAGGVDIPLPSSSYNDNNGGTGLNMQTILGINYATHGGIHLGGDCTVGTTEARICWNCHYADTAGVASHKAEFGVDNNANTGNMTYNYGSLSTWNATDNGAWYATDNVTAANWTASYAGFGYKTGGLQSMHSTAMVGSTPKSAGPGKKALADIRCSYCHDVHDLNKASRTTTGTGAATYADTVTGPPYLRGTWKGDPYKNEDGAPQSGTTYTNLTPFGAVPRGSTSQATMGGYWIDNNSGRPTATWTLANSAGLCVLCHNSDVDNMKVYDNSAWFSPNGHSNSAIGGTAIYSVNLLDARGGAANSSYNSLMAFQGSSDPGDGTGAFRATVANTENTPSTTLQLKPTLFDATGADPRAFQGYQWGATVATTTTIDKQYHRFSCSKCHNPHASRLPRLMITNCLDTKHNTWQNDAAQSVYTSATAPVNTNKKISMWTSSQNCHRLSATTDNATTGKGWNKVTPW